MRACRLSVLLLLPMMVAAALPLQVGAADTRSTTTPSGGMSDPLPSRPAPGPVVSAPVTPGRNQDLPAIAATGPFADTKAEPAERPGARLLSHTGTNQATPAGAAALDPGIDNAVHPNSMPNPIVNFEGMNNLNGVYPPDTDGSVGPNHYVQMVNLSTAIYDKSGTLLYGPFTPNLLWPSGDPCQTTNDGDVIVLYDRWHDRWVLSQFALPSDPSPPYYQCIAVSKGPVPTNVPGDYWTYTFQMPGNNMNDYPKLALWPDALYMTDNQFTNGASWGGAGVFAFDYARMLLGQAATFQYFDLFAANPNFGGMLPVELEGPSLPPAGAPAFFLEVDDSTWIPPNDALRIWKFHADWTNPANSTFGLNLQPNFIVPVTDFNPLPCTVSGSHSCIPQQGTAVRLDGIGDRLMYRATYRNFGDHSSIVFNHTVKGADPDVAGIRWYEVRNAETTPAIYQQGTYAPADGAYRWMASMTMDHAGNIGLGYSVSSGSMYPSIRYTGRLATDPLGTMPQGEATIIDGTGAQTGTKSRWGDYSAMAIDPVDDCTFWYTQEHIQTTGAAPWRTRIASLKFPGCQARRLIYLPSVFK